MDDRKYQINQERFKHDFDCLAQIGSTGDGGVSRPAFSDAHLQARDWFRDLSLKRGFSFRVDGAGNHIARLECSTPEAPVFLIGSHLDSVPNGGRFDGALGVIAGLEVLTSFQDFGLGLPFNLEVVDFTDEEGAMANFIGSSYLSGQLSAEKIENPRGGREGLLSGLAAAGLTLEDLLNPEQEEHNYLGYLELHIEQGTKLIEAGRDIGVVTGIVGIRSYRLIFTGEENHAGTTSMHHRQDAIQGAADYTLRVHELVRNQFPACAANVGNILVEPGRFNIIPKRATLSLEFRAPEINLLDSLDAALINEAENTAKEYRLEFQAERAEKHNPVFMDKKIISYIQLAAEMLDLDYCQLTSGAGHDAQYMATICPSGMIFIPSANGVSHSPKEFSEWEDCINGANVLLQTVLGVKDVF